MHRSNSDVGMTSNGRNGLINILGCGNQEAVQVSTKSERNMSRSKVSYREARGWGKDFKKVMENSTGRNLLLEFLIGEHSDSNLNFWEQIEAFRYQRNAKERKKLAKDIFDKFIGESAKTEVPLESKTVKDIAEAIKTNQTKVEMFDEAQSSIYRIIKQGSYHRFVKSRTYWDYLTSTVPTEEINVWSKSFEKLINHDVGRFMLGQYLTSEYADENIRFWEEVQEYKIQPSQKDREFRAKQIFKKYLDKEAKTEVSVDYKTHQQIQQNMEEAPIDLFEGAVQVAYSCMKKDNYPRYIKSTPFKELIADRSKETQSE